MVFEHRYSLGIVGFEVVCGRLGPSDRLGQGSIWEALYESATEGGIARPVYFIPLGSLTNIQKLFGDKRMGVTIEVYYHSWLSHSGRGTDATQPP